MIFTFRKCVQIDSENGFVQISEEVYLPVVQATDVLEILNLILRIMCEAWLDHIYVQKIKFRYFFLFEIEILIVMPLNQLLISKFFSREGALNLLRDFEGVSEWIIACKDILPEHVEILAKHEVLRTCEGVGKILLRKPFEVIPINEPAAFTPRVQHAKPNGIVIYRNQSKFGNNLKNFFRLRR